MKDGGKGIITDVALNLRRVVFGIPIVVALLFGATSVLHGCMNGHSRPNGHGDITFGISPSGRQIVFNGIGDGGRDLYLLDLKNSQVTQLIKSPDYEGSPSFSPDGKFIIYAAGAVGDRADHLFIRSLDGLNVKQLTNEDYNDENPSFSPDGTQIVFTRNLTYNWGGLAASWGSDEVTCLMNSDGSQLRRISSGDLIKGNGTQTTRNLTSKFQRWRPVFSTDGKQMTFAKGHYSPDYQIYIMNTSGKTPHQLTHVAGGCFKPRFTPDGKHILFLVESWPNGPSGTQKYSLWKIRTDGKNATQVADSRLFDDPLHWKP